jgi:2-aminomuconate deaminase
MSEQNASDSGLIRTQAAPKPVGAYPHARRVGDFIFVSGMGPRQAGTDAIPGGPIKDADGNPQDYDIEAQTRAVIENIRVVLEAAGSSLDRVVDCTSFLVDMDRDFKGYNAVYAEYFTGIQATRTTIAITALPTPIAVEMKVIALANDAAAS